MSPGRSWENKASKQATPAPRSAAPVHLLPRRAELGEHGNNEVGAGEGPELRHPLRVRPFLDHDAHARQLGKHLRCRRQPRRSCSAEQQAVALSSWAGLGAAVLPSIQRHTGISGFSLGWSSLPALNETQRGVALSGGMNGGDVGSARIGQKTEQGLPPSQLQTRRRPRRRVTKPSTLLPAASTQSGPFRTPLPISPPASPCAMLSKASFFFSSQRSA